MLLIGWLLIAGGVLEVIHAFACKGMERILYRPVDRTVVRRRGLYDRRQS